MSAPSASRWSAFSVRPPSASRISVSSTVSKRNASAELRSRRPAGQRQDRRRRRWRRRAARRRRRPGGPGSAGWPRSREPGRERRRRSGPRSGRGRGVGRRVDGTSRSRCCACSARSADEPGAPRRSAASVIAASPPAGWTSSRREAAVGVARARPVAIGDEPARRRRVGCARRDRVASDDQAPDRAVSTNVPGHGW